MVLNQLLESGMKFLPDCYVILTFHVATVTLLCIFASIADARNCFLDFSVCNCNSWHVCQGMHRATCTGLVYLHGLPHMNMSLIEAAPKFCQLHHLASHHGLHGHLPGPHSCTTFLHPSPCPVLVTWCAFLSISDMHVFLF